MKLTDKAMLVSLNIKQWTARKYDKGITDEVNHTHQSQDAGRFNKLLVNKDSLKEIQKASNALRVFHYANTLAWNDDGSRLLPVENYFDYLEKMTVLKNEFDSAARKFIDDYPNIIQEAKVKLNNLFNEREYPSNISGKFDVRYSIMPMPDSSDFRVDVENIEEIRKGIEEEIQSKVKDAIDDLRDRLKGHLRRMKEVLSNPKSKIHESLFTNLEDLRALAKKLNVTNDYLVRGLIENSQDVANFSVEEVRKSPEKRQELLGLIDSIC